MARRSAVVAGLAFGLPVLSGFVFSLNSDKLDGFAFTLIVLFYLIGTGLAAGGAIALAMEQQWALAIPCSVLPVAVIIFFMQPGVLLWLLTLAVRPVP